MRHTPPMARRTARRALAWLFVVPWLSGGCDYADKVAVSDVGTASDGVVPGDGTSGGTGGETNGETVGAEVPDPYAPDPRGPEHVVLRRLNRTEWANTVRDLIGTRQDLAHDLPADDLGYGFDNIASVLTLSPLHLELYERAAALLAHEALTPPITAPLFLRLEAETAESDDPYGQVAGDFYFLGSGGGLTADVDVPRAGHYVFEARAFEDHAGDANALMAFSIDGLPVGSVSVTAPNAGAAAIYTVEVDVTAGRHALGVAFANDFYEPPADRNLSVDYFGLRGPAALDVLAETAWGRVVPCSVAAMAAEDVACAETLVAQLAYRAWRRPVTPAELAALLAFFTDARAEGTPFLEALELPVRAILLAPHFLFKVEHPLAAGATAPEPLDGYELATRLAYFLWSSMPDDALLAAARDGHLATAAGIATEVTRMLADPKARALVDDFASEWLYVRDIANVFPDQTAFPEFDEGLRTAMIGEMQRFLATFFSDARPVRDLLTASDTVVNQRLAEHYGLSLQLADAETWQTVDLALANVPRRGILGKAGVMTALSTPFRTSIVRRGKWVLGQLLCAEPRAPPADVPSLPPTADGGAPTTLRAMMEAHMTEERCRNCHESMDPIGFALEPYDGIGAWRTTDNGFPIDATGKLPSGETFDGPVALATTLAGDPRLDACVIEKLFVYALGRGVRLSDRDQLTGLASGFAEAGTALGALVRLIATSDTFRMRGVPGVAAPSDEVTP